MKELSIEEKAKRYDEAINAIKELKSKHPTAHVIKDWIKENFPELVESEDEKIRKALIHLISEQDGFLTAINGISVKDILAWLEKKQKIQPKFKIGDIIRFKGNETLKGEAEAHKIVGYDNELYVFSDGTTDLFCEQDLYELVEQKPAYKIGPKFDVGDWITDGYNKIRIVSVKDGVYKYSNNYILGNIKSIDKRYHLWTIQDAKDGNVLAVDNMIFIYKRVLASHIVSYCTLINNVFEPYEYGRTCCEGNRYVHPATKEQCDLLFSKMKEAGYEWDVEKKELKDISKKI